MNENDKKNNPPTYKARKFICNSQVMTSPQDINAYAKLMFNLTKCIGWVRTEKSEERMRVAIDSLAEYILGKFDEGYEPEERAYTFHGHEEVPATWKIKAKSEEEAKQKFDRLRADATISEDASYYAIDEGEVDPNETYIEEE